MHMDIACFDLGGESKKTAVAQPSREWQAALSSSIHALQMDFKQLRSNTEFLELHRTMF
jgi:hypothetical protein